MPPRLRFTRDEILQSAVSLVREKGPEALNARALAAALGASTQPIFSNFKNMEEIRQEVIGEGERLFQAACDREFRRGEVPPYKAMGMAYAAFAGEEPALFRLLFMRDRRGEEPGKGEAWEDAIALIRRQLGLNQREAELFHLEIWSAVHGIAVMAATGYLSLDRDLISRILTDLYTGLSHRFNQGGNEQ